MAPSTTDKRLKGAIKLHRQNISLVQTFCEEQLSTASIQFCRRYLDKLVESYNLFIKSQTSFELTEECVDIDFVLRGEIEKLFLELSSTIETRIDELNEAKKKATSNPHNENHPSSSPKLPDIQLDSFSGEILKWPEFINSFDALVYSNANLNEITKFQYLRRALSGSAKLIIENLDFTEENYEQARQLLIDQFDDHKHICEEHIKSLFTYKPLDKPCHRKLSDLLSFFNSHLRSLRSQKRPVEHWDDLLVYLIASKFDSETKLKWIDSAPSKRVPTLKEISSFIKTRCQKLESQFHARNPAKSSQSSLPKPPMSIKPPILPPVQSFHATTKTFHCHYCNVSGHSLLRCNSFKALSILKRREAVERLKLCFNCLSKDHTFAKCPSSDSCHVCQRRHHTLTHRDAIPSASSVTTTTTHLSNQPSTSTQGTVPTSLMNVSLPSRNNSSYILLATALIYVYDKFGTPVTARALLDSGSQLNFMSQSFASLIGVKLKQTAESISGIGSSTITSLSSANVVFKSCQSSYSATIECLILPKITDNQPTLRIDISEFNIPGNIKLADPQFYSPQKIDMLLGAGLYFELMSVGQIKLANHLPVIQNTQLGWVLAGQISSSSAKSSTDLASSALSAMTLDHQVERFWKLDSVPEDSKLDSVFDHICEQHFTSTYSRDDKGKFVVRLPFSENPPSLGDSSSMAKRRFYNLERRLIRDSQVGQMYKKFIEEYIELDHMVLVPDDEIKPTSFYFPHHCVLKPESSSTKLRVVFDGSAKTTNGKSLNDILMVGPVVQSELFFILCRFRSHRYAFSADVSKMYRQVWVHEDDCEFQYIFWRDNPSETLRSYKLKTVTYGSSSAPYLATRCLLQLALDSEQTHPSASATIRNDVYVDDLLAGANTIAEAKTLKSDIVSILSSASMNLRKWCSNSDDVILDVPVDHRETCLDIDDDNFVKTLGILWQPNKDLFQFKVQNSSHQRISKRIILSEVASIFDPIGFLAPVVVLGKLFIQNLWQLKIDWDAALPLSHHSAWEAFRSELRKLNDLVIPRHLFGGIDQPTLIQLHGFADASEKAFGAAIYTRCTLPDGTFIIRLLCCKSRVAPLRKTTLPRLELCAAQLLAQLMRKITNTINFSVSRVFYWSDSMIVLHWINGAPSTWATFVANRVAEIQEISHKNQWFHVRSQSNPADVVSRSMMPSKLIDCEMWFNGPSFLYSTDNEWCTEPLNLEDIENVPEKKKIASVLVSSIKDQQCDDPLRNLKFWDDYSRLVTTMSYVYRFLGNVKLPSESRIRRPLKDEDLEGGTKLIVCLIQRKHFPDVIKQLHSKSQFVTDCHLKSLSLFIDNDDVIRVGGRLQFSSLSYSSKHPMLLPSDHFFSSLLLSFIHRKHLHAGPQALLAIVREKFWLINGLRLAKRTCRNCVRCVRTRPRLNNQMMGSLPQERVQMSPPFYTVAIDFAGPIYIHYKIRGKIPTKTYICIFVCMSTKAVHIEIASDLSSAAFIGAFKRFISTRGLCKNVFTDNGTNFIGATSEMHKLYVLLQSSELSSEIKLMCREDHINWHFYPAGSPHFGGLHEAAVKSAKYHIRRVMGLASLTYEEFNTLLKQVEAVMNSRPLTPLASDSDDLAAITPGHFLIGRPLVAVPEPNIKDENLSHTKRWRLVQLLHQQFWARWSQDYLQSLQHRRKCVKTSPNIQVGEIVLIKDENLPALKWKIGRIIETFPGADGLTRVVSIKTSNGVTKRTVTKICPLPINIERTVQGGENVGEQANKTNIKI